MNQRTTILLWIDTETTAIDPEDGDLLEIGMIATDLKAETELTRFVTVIGHDLTAVPIGSTAALRMHLDNGLLDKVGDGEQPDIDTVGKELREFLFNLTDRHQVIPSGTNLQFDLDWINAKIPDNGLEFLSHRRNDLSTNRIQQLALGHNPYDQRHDTTHRVETCINRDIHDYQATLKQLEQALAAGEAHQ